MRISHGVGSAFNFVLHAGYEDECSEPPLANAAMFFMRLHAVGPHIWPYWYFFVNLQRISDEISFLSCMCTEIESSRARTMSELINTSSLVAESHIIFAG